MTGPVDARQEQLRQHLRKLCLDLATQITSLKTAEGHLTWARAFQQWIEQVDDQTTRDARYDCLARAVRSVGETDAHGIRRFTPEMVFAAAKQYATFLEDDSG